MKLRLVNTLNTYQITDRKEFKPLGRLSDEYKLSIFEFAWNMSFGQLGEHRQYRSGGTNVRTKMEIFCDAFIGKIGESVVVDYLNQKGLSAPEPDFNTYGKGIWDDYDLDINDKKIAIKTTKHFGQLLLLETKDWNENGDYIPNLLKSGYKSYDFFIAVRIKHSLIENLKKEKINKNQKINIETLRKICNKDSYEYDIPGYMTRKTLVFLIDKDYKIKQGDYINTTKMDATNYYIQMCDLKPIDHMINNIK